MRGVHHRLLAAASLPILATAVLSALATGAHAGPAVTPTTAPAASVTVAKHAAAWLAGQLGTKGYLTDSSGVDYSDTVQAALAIDAAGVDLTSAHKALAYIAAHDSYLGGDTPTTDSAGSLALLILAAHADGEDPTKFGGSAAPDNLVARLLATQGAYVDPANPSANNKGLFDPTAADVTYSAVFDQGLALAALKAAGDATSTAVTAGVRWLKAQQCDNGGWGGYRPSTTTSCAAAEPSAGNGEDSNSSALAIEGLKAVGATPRVSPLTYLHSVQSSDGGFAYDTPPGTFDDPDSTGEVIQALIALGQNPTASTWTKKGVTPYQRLKKFQLTTGANAGAFDFSAPPSTANVIATVQATPGAAGKPFPLATTPPPSATSVATNTAGATSSTSATTRASTTTTTALVLVAATTTARRAAVGSTASALPFTGAPDTIRLTVVGALVAVAGVAAMLLGQWWIGSHQR